MSMPVLPGDIWLLCTAQPTTAEGAKCRRYLHQLDLGGQDWAMFFEALLPIAERVASAKEFHSIIPAELERADALNEFQMRVYEKWLPDYLQGELHDEHPRPFATFLYDRFRDFLRTRQETIANQRHLVHEQARTIPPNGKHQRRSTGAKAGIGDPTNGHQAVEFAIDHETNGVRYSFWPAAVSSPEFAVQFWEFVNHLPQPLGKVAQMLAEGRTNREVAAVMGTDESTVSRQRRRIAAMWDADEEGGEDS